MMKSVKPLLPSDFPEDGLRFFHGLSNWIELYKGTKPHLTNWKHGMKALTKLSCVKPKKGESLKIPADLGKDTLYVPTSAYGYFVLSHLRNAFCHNALVYDKSNKQYRIQTNEKLNIAGQFSLEAIEDFVKAFFNETK